MAKNRKYTEMIHVRVMHELFGLRPWWETFPTGYRYGSNWEDLSIIIHFFMNFEKQLKLLV